jgi:hypothetical protein
MTVLAAASPKLSRTYSTASVRDFSRSTPAADRLSPALLAVAAVILSMRLAAKLAASSLLTVSDPARDVLSSGSARLMDRVSRLSAVVPVSDRRLDSPEETEVMSMATSSHALVLSYRRFSGCL